MRTQIPEGYELLPGRNKENAIQALAIASERGLQPETVLTIGEGYLIPLYVVTPVEVASPDETWKVADIEAFAQEWEIDLGDAKNKAEKVAAINAEIERRTEAAESGELTPVGEPADGDESEKED